MDTFRFFRRLALAIVFVGATVPALAAPSAGAPTIDINHADAATLANAIDGVGQSRAQAIVDYRKAHGPFKSVEELTRIKGIGPATVKNNRERLSVH